MALREAEQKGSQMLKDAQGIPRLRDEAQRGGPRGMVIRAMNTLKRKDAAAPPKPSREEELLTEIRDLLKKA
jgi:hypothetical protein